MSGFEEIVEYAKGITSVIGCVTGVCAFIVALIKPLRKRSTAFIRKIVHTQEHEESIAQVVAKLEDIEVKLDELNDKTARNCTGTKVSLGNTIKHIYLKYYKIKKIPCREKEAMVLLHDAYKGLHGNSCIDEMYEEAMTWEVV